MKLLTRIALLSCLIFSVYACNDQRKAKNYNEKTQVDDQALPFLQKGIQSGNAEVKLSELALKNSQNVEIKQFAQMMINDHTQNGKELTDLASKRKVNIPDGIDTEHNRILTSLTTKTGADFDKEYMQVMVHDHEKAIGLFETVTDNTDKKINDLADKTLPKLREHLKEANAICAKLK
ncbi:DUF4142 domain-containing protein [Mucilaginibacter terrenus]|uniref:DUF4142 domain-containing protein n=1 Tax=Mucilaginibacter terrenus TaxID=2482727 RepID=A0A3E2NVH5_9SPHI|nr:DUF4142 domain-containing protein [Mucilaginibacter terrenus]RFZ85002.1 DUF4142 domain-containing protein [Mucilaginibacter terrenus]